MQASEASPSQPSCTPPCTALSIPLSPPTSRPCSTPCKTIFLSHLFQRTHHRGLVLAKPVPPPVCVVEPFRVVAPAASGGWPGHHGSNTPPMWFTIKDATRAGSDTTGGGGSSRRLPRVLHSSQRDSSVERVRSDGAISVERGGRADSSEAEARRDAGDDATDTTLSGSAPLKHLIRGKGPAAQPRGRAARGGVIRQVLHATPVVVFAAPQPGFNGGYGQQYAHVSGAKQPHGGSEAPCGPGLSRHTPPGAQEEAGEGPPAEGSPPPSRLYQAAANSGAASPDDIGEEGQAKGGRQRRPWHVEGAAKPRKSNQPSRAGGSSPKKEAGKGGIVDPGGEGKDKGRRGEMIANKLKEPIQRTNNLGVLGAYVPPTDEEVARARRDTARCVF